MSNNGVNVDLIEQGVRTGDRFALSRAITLVESKHPEDRAQAAELLERLTNKNRTSLRVGVTGVPGAGKSTFLECLGMSLIRSGNKIAILSVDPSSVLSKGSILGDKTRMELLAREPAAFIRPSASGSILGGVAGHTREAIILCEAAGYQYVFVETVGVGQSEVAVHQLTDIFILLLLTGSGDDLQGMKRGIMELADLMIVNKADGENLAPAQQYAGEITQMIQFLPPHPFNWKVPVITVSSLTGDGIPFVERNMSDYQFRFRTNGFIESKRSQQNVQWLNQKIEQHLLMNFYKQNGIYQLKAELEDKVRTGQLSVDQAIKRIFS